MKKLGFVVVLAALATACTSRQADGNGASSVLEDETTTDVATASGNFVYFYSSQETSKVMAYGANGWIGGDRKDAQEGYPTVYGFTLTATVGSKVWFAKTDAAGQWRQVSVTVNGTTTPSSDDLTKANGIAAFQQYGGYAFLGTGPANSIFKVLPGQTIAVCNQGVTQAVADSVVDALHTWLAPIGRAKHVGIVQACSGDCVIDLKPLGSTYGEVISGYGQTYPPVNGRHVIEAAQAWAGNYTARHEVGHAFGFDHFQVQPGQAVMEGSATAPGAVLTSYDLAGIAAMLQTTDVSPSTRRWLEFLGQAR